MLQRVERHIITNSKSHEQLCFNAARLYNFVNYHLRQVCFGKMQKISEYEMSGLLAECDQDDFRNLPSNTSQQIIKLVYKNWKSYFKSIKAYKKQPEKSQSTTKIPKYKKKTGLGIAIFTYTQVRIKDGYIKFPKMTNLSPLKTKVKKLQQVRIIPQATVFVVEVIYNIEPKKSNVKEDNILSVDLGINNLATTINNVGKQPFIINGKPLKAHNQFFNKRRAKLQSYVGKGTSNRIRRLTHKRNCKVNDYLHKTSRFIIDYCIEHKIGTIVIGKNDGWKNKVNIGKVNNQKFVSIPHSKLIQQITYKAEDVGIIVKEQQESHTSKCDALALEKICHHKKYLGRRIKRGLFQSSTGRLINADVNGAINIVRKSKVFQNAKWLLDRGVADTPVRYNIAA